MPIEHLLEQAPAPTRRRFLTTTVGGLTGLALLPGAALANTPKPKPGSAPTEQPPAFVHISPEGRTTILCNRMDMGQGVETGLALCCAEELDADWAQVVTGFGDQGQAYVDPTIGMHLTGGSMSLKNSFTQYRELGARCRAMLIGAAARAWNLPAAQLRTEPGKVLAPDGRSASYGSLFAEAMKLAVPEAAPLKDAKDFRLIGKGKGLTVARAKSSGAQTYGMDIRLPGMKTAVVQRPPVFNGTVKSFDAKAALAMPGVRAVFPTALDKGGEGIAVVADSYWQAQQARNALKIEWDLSKVEKVDTEALRKQYLALAKTEGMLAPRDYFKADVKAGAKAPKKIVAEYVFPYLNHAQMEPLACTVDLREDGCTLYYASQMPGIDAMAVAALTKLPPDKIQVNVQMAGGGFGRRATPGAETPTEAVAVAMVLARMGQRAPVKLVWSREDDMKAGYYRPFAVHRAEIGFQSDGKVLGWTHRVVCQSIVMGTPFEAFMVKDGVDNSAVEGMTDPYDVPMRVSVHHPKHNVPVLWWRSVGSTHTAFVMETLIDELAVACKKDPVAYRLAIMDKEAVRNRAALQLAVDKSGYGKRKLPPGQAWGVAVHESFSTVVAYVVVASIEGKGKDRRPRLHEVHAGVHCNLCVNPKSVENQIQGAVTMALGMTMPGHRITLKDGVVEQGNFHELLMPRITDAPKLVAVHIVPSTEPPTGVGEPGLPPLAPALANAVARLTGQRQRELPFKFS